MKSSNIDHHPYPEGRDKAIRNLGGMEWLYDKHLYRFRMNYADSYDKALEYLLQGRNNDARILIHTVKGLSGTLGLEQLYQASSLLERAIITMDPSLFTVLNSYNLRLKEAIPAQNKE